MGNCQAIDNASLVLQHPCGRVDRLYSPVPASQIMKLNPGHYVALLLTTTTTTTAAGEKNKSNNSSNNNSNRVRITRIKLLRPTDTLALGHAYRLITTQEVMKGLWAKKCAKMKKREEPREHHQSVEKQERIKDKAAASDFGTTPAAAATAATGSGSELETINQGIRNERSHRRTTSSSRGGWHPSLQSISEAAAGS